MKYIPTGILAAILGMLDSFTISLFNVPLNVIMLAGAGALLSPAFANDSQDVSRKRFYFSLAARTFTAVAVVSVAPAAMGWEWYSTKMEGSLAFIFALAAGTAVPAVFKLVPEIIKKWFKLQEYKDTGNTRGLSRDYEREDDEADTEVKI